MKRILLISPFFLLVVSCNNTSNSCDPSRIDSIDSDLTKSIHCDAIHPKLMEVLVSDFHFNDPIIPGGGITHLIYSVDVSKRGSDCFIVITISHIYNSSGLKGFILSNDNKMIAFYNPESECIEGLVNLGGLMKEISDIPVDFPDENSELIGSIIFDGKSQEYRIEKNGEDIHLTFIRKFCC